MSSFSLFARLYLHLSTDYLLCTKCLLIRMFHVLELEISVSLFSHPYLTADTAFLYLWNTLVIIGEVYMTELFQECQS